MVLTPLTAWDSVSKLVTEAVMTKKGRLINDAQKTDYSTLGYFWRGQPFARQARGGSNMMGLAFLDAKRRVQYQTTGATQTYGIDDKQVKWQQSFQEFSTYLAFEDNFVEAAMGESLSDEARFMVIAEYVDTEYQKMATDLMGWLNERPWQVPQKAIHEGLNATAIMPLTAMVNQHTNGLFQETPGTAPTYWTTVQGIDPTAAGQTNWKPTLIPYGSVADKAFEVKHPQNILKAYDYAAATMKYNKPPMLAEHFTEKSRPVAFMSPEAYVAHCVLYRNSQDRWTDPNDPAGNPTYKGIVFVSVNELTALAVYINGAALATEQAAAVIGPRIYLLDPDTINIVPNSNVFMKDVLGGAQRDTERPRTAVQPFWFKANTACWSRRRQALLHPAANQALTTWA